MIRLRRHALLRVKPARWPQILARQGTAEAEAVLGEWALRGWPVMVRRYLPGESHDGVPVAVSLPPQPCRAGRTLQLREDEIDAVLSAQPLRMSLEHAPPAWRPALRSLIVLGGRCDSEPALYGSLLWQQLTGLNFLTARSDLDISWPVRDPQQAQSLVSALARIEHDSPVRIDGELLLADGAGVAWREFAAAASDDELLVKTVYTLSMRSRAVLFAPAVAA